MKQSQSQQIPQISTSNSSIKILCLGAGREVGRSCVLVRIKDKNIIFDTGIHMLYSDQRRYPNFSSLYTPPQTINSCIDLVLITHFHLDHCGALPYLTQFHQYSGPIYTSTPTKSMIPYMLQDFRKVTSDVKKQQSQFYTYTIDEIKNACRKINTISLQQTIQMKNNIKITSYYAGHVLGACMFHVEYDGLSVMYTGDYNSYGDRHLGAAYAPRLCPNVVLTETTYATTIRDTKRDRQRKMLKIVTETLQRGGKVLIPVFALGRAQQLSVLLQTYWKMTDNKHPIYFSAGLIQKANFYYQLFVDWQNQKIKQQFKNGQSIFEFKKVKPFDKSLIRSQTPYVLFATPGMLHGGTSMQVFKQWCNNQLNTIIIPGYCVQGTIGNKLLKGIKTLDIDKKRYQVKMQVQNISFSAHADAKGIINLLRHLNMENIVFVHGDGTKMDAFAEIVQEQLQKKVYMPENHKEIQIPVTQKIQIKTFKDNLAYPQGYLIKDTTNINTINNNNTNTINTTTTIINTTSTNNNNTTNIIINNNNIINKSNTYKMIKQNQLLKQVNLMNSLMNNNPGVIVDSVINFQLNLDKLSEEQIKKLALQSLCACNMNINIYDDNRNIIENQLQLEQRQRRIDYYQQQKQQQHMQIEKYMIIKEIKQEEQLGQIKQVKINPQHNINNNSNSNVVKFKATIEQIVQKLLK